MSTDQKTTETTPEDHSATIARSLGRGLHDHAMQRIAITANIATAVIAVGVALAARFVLPWPAAKFLVGLAAVVFVAALAGMAYRRYVQTEPAAEKKQEVA